MDDSIGLLLLFQLVLIMLNAIFASAEIAVLSISETKLEHMADDGNGRAKKLYKLAKEPARFLATIQVAITLSGFLGSAFAADNFSTPLVEWIDPGHHAPPHPAKHSGGGHNPCTFIFHPHIRRACTQAHRHEEVGTDSAGSIRPFEFHFRHIQAYSRPALRFHQSCAAPSSGIDPNETDDNVSEEEIRMMVDAGSEKGTIDHQEKEFIQNVLEFNDIMAGEIATHRTDVTALMTDDTLDEWDEIIHESRHTRYPVCDGSTDNVIGILNAKDYFRIADRTKEKVLEEAVHPAYFVPETIKADVLFRDMKNTRNSLAVVLDEYGGMVGIITLNDLIEELVGELNDEPADPENEDPHIEKIDDTSWRVIGNVELCDLEEETGVELASDDYDTLTGLVFDKLGMVPADGPQNITIELDKLTVQHRQNRVPPDRLRRHNVKAQRGNGR